ncbi:division/cell wall cluster transcriptional repressor MraZ [Castellaniella sp. GW247-6E4]|uniref:division/cell wall cluster transcriptional repressor MraZ n=1 Tax=Castellaniella sp. GW247-6E4 TaxID=3140380 RepID=UPI003314AD63
MFQGSSALTLDAKGRMSIPARHRDVLLSTEQGRLTITRHPDGCLMIYPRTAWEAKREQIAALPMNARALQRLLLGSAQDVELDGAGRILIAPELRTAAHMTRDVMLMGIGTHFELWDSAEWARRDTEDIENLDPAVLEKFTF